MNKRKKKKKVRGTVTRTQKSSSYSISLSPLNRVSLALSQSPFPIALASSQSPFSQSLFHPHVSLRPSIVHNTTQGERESMVSKRESSENLTFSAMTTAQVMLKSSPFASSNTGFVLILGLGFLWCFVRLSIFSSSFSQYLFRSYLSLQL